MIPTSSPTTTEHPMSAQLLIPRSQRMRNVAATISTELRLVPKERAASRFFIEASSLVRTEKIPTMERRIPTAAISIGAITALYCITTSPVSRYAAAPSAEVARIEPQYDS